MLLRTLPLRGVCVLLLVACAGGTCRSAPLLQQGLGAEEKADVIPVVVFEHDDRLSVAGFAAAQKLDVGLVQRRHAASGLIRCGHVHGAGQLTLSDDIITTSAHVFYDQTGALRSDSCEFVLGDAPATRILQIDLDSIVAGSKNPYAEDPVHDWAVARLARPAIGITPYNIADTIAPEMAVEFAARGHRDWGDRRRLSLEQCHLRNQLAKGAEGTREFAVDCDTGDGASGGAVLIDQGVPQLAAVLVGWRSNAPGQPAPFSAMHYNFVVSVEGAFRAAVYAAARETTAAH